MVSVWSDSVFLFMAECVFWMENQRTTAKFLLNWFEMYLNMTYYVLHRYISFSQT